jgi:succinate dehydrogenase / fumarate reductase, membrane anchor subunit
MVKSVLGVNHQGLRDWLIQRVSALLMVIYVIGMGLFFIAHPDLTYMEWYSLFSALWMKVATLLVLVSILFHAWVGIWTVLTDYIHHFAWRLVLNLTVLVALAAFFFAGLLILWSF